MRNPRGSFYDPVAHAYLMNGTQWPSVTQALYGGGWINKRFYTPEAAAHGRLVHKLTLTFDLLKSLRDVDPPPDCGAEIEAYAAFVRDYGPAWEAIEQPFWHRGLRFGGRPDRIWRRLRTFDGPGTLELKTGSPADWHRYQLAGYQRGRPRGARAVCYLGRNGRYKFVCCTDPIDHSRFLYSLQETWKTWPNVT